MIKAIVFDFDGVILDTETPDYETWAEVYTEHGARLDRALWEGFIGGSSASFDVLGHLRESSSAPLDGEAVRVQRRQRYIDRIDASPVLPGVLEYLRDAKTRKLRLAVASSSSVDWVEGHLARRRLLPYFDSIRARDHVAKVKPDPELYATSVAGLGVQPHEAVAIEDSANGVNAAKAAGLFCVVVPNPMTVDLPTQAADMRLDALSDMPLGALLERIAEVG